MIIIPKHSASNIYVIHIYISQLIHFRFFFCNHTIVLYISVNWIASFFLLSNRKIYMSKVSTNPYFAFKYAHTQTYILNIQIGFNCSNRINISFPCHKCWSHQRYATGRFAFSLFQFLFGRILLIIHCIISFSFFFLGWYFINKKKTMCVHLKWQHNCKLQWQIHSLLYFNIVSNANAFITN